MADNSSSYVLVEWEKGKFKRTRVSASMQFDEYGSDLELEARGPENVIYTPADEIKYPSTIRNFSVMMESYRSFIGLVLGLVPFLSRSSLDTKLKRFLKKHGNRIKEVSTDDREIYEVDDSELKSFSDILDGGVSDFMGASHLPDVMIIGLISVFDAYLADLLKVTFNSRPETIFQSNRNISYSDLIKMKTIDDARKQIIDKEIESILRLSHVDHFEWMENKFDMKLRSKLEVWPLFVELCERRNLYTHTGGIVSEQYLQNCRKNGVNDITVVIGERLTTDSEYYKKAVSTVYEIGLKLGHTLWRKMLPDDLEAADRDLINTSYELTLKPDYRLATKMLQFGVEQRKHSSDSTRRILIINLASVLNLQDKIEEAAGVLGSQDWSATQARFRMCVAAIKEDLSEFEKLLNIIKNSDEISIYEFRNWPVFKKIRENKQFTSAFEAVYGVPMTIKSSRDFSELNKSNDIADEAT